MQMGDLELHLLIAGHWKADGGLMFGVVPKVLWEKKKPADGNNMIDMACVGLIARINGRWSCARPASHEAQREGAGRLRSVSPRACCSRCGGWDHAG